MKILLAIATTLLCLSAFAQQPTVINDPEAKSRTLNGSFSAISVTDGISLFLTSSNEESIAVSFADPKYEEKFKTVVEDGVLKIYFDNKGLNYSDNKRRQLKAYVSFKTLDKLTASGGASVKLPAAVTVGNMDMKFSSGASFEGEMKAKEITVDQSSGSVVNMTGSADKISLEASSGAIFKGYDLSGDICEAKASSGGEVRISVGKELSAHASSGGSIRYKGTAVLKEINISSGGTIKKV